MQITQNLDFSWQITHDKSQIVLRDLTMGDLLWLESCGLNLQNNPLGVLALYNRLVIEEGFLPTDLGIREYEVFMSLLVKNVLEERIFSPDSCLEILWLIGGQMFTPNVQEWFDKPLTLILALAAVAKKYPRMTL